MNNETIYKMDDETIDKITEEICSAVADWESSWTITPDRESIVDEDRIEYIVTYQPNIDGIIKKTYVITCRYRGYCDGAEFEVGDEGSWWRVCKENIFAYFWFEEVYKKCQR